MRQSLSALARIRQGLSVALAILGSLAVLALMLHVSLDVIMRNALNAPIPATYEIVTNYYMVAMAFIPLAWVERGKGMVQVELLEAVMNPAARRVSDAFVALISTLIYGALAWLTFKTALSNFSTGTFVMAQSLAVPTWPAFFFLPIGFALAAMTTFLRLFETSSETPA